MNKMMMVTSGLALAFLGAFALVCAVAILWKKTKSLSIWKMPRLRLAVLAGACVVATIAAQKTTGIRYVDANAPAGGDGLSWNTAARTIDEVSRDLYGGTIYVKPGTYGAFSYWTVGDYISSNPLEIIATGGVDETIINGKMSPKSDVLTPSWTTLRLSGFTVCGVSDIWCVDLDRCVVSNCHEMAAYGSAFKNCLLTENSAYFLCCTYSGCTVVGNSGSCITAGSSAAWNTIFWNNSSGGGMPDYDILAATNCCMDVMREGAGNFSGNPLFVDAENGNYRLAGGSPCIDAGDNAWVSGGRDLAGNDRVQNGAVDIGAFETPFEEDTGVRCVDARAPAGGSGLSWKSAARTIDEVSRDLCGGVIYVKPGTYGAFAYHEPSPTGTVLRVVATGSPEETVIDGAGVNGIESLEADLPHELAPSPEKPYIHIEGFTVRNMGTRACDQAFDRCIVSNFTKGVAYSSSFRNCLIAGNESSLCTGLFDSCWFDNCTVTGNRSTTVVGRHGVARNSIFWGNAGTPYSFLYATNCCLEGAAQEGAGNISNDPRFVGAEKGNYSLAEGSPCIDAGDNALSFGDRDLAGMARIQNETVDIGAYESLPPARLVYRSTLDSESAVVNPLVGEGGTCSGAAFVEGKFGSALYVPEHSDVAAIPLPGGLPQARGCIEFWAKLQEGKSSYYAGGDPTFIRIFDAETGSQVFSIEFNANNGGGRGGICAGLAGMSVAPESYGYSKPYSGTITEGSVSDWHRYAFAWNVDGIDAIAGEPNAAILVDGQVKAWTKIASGWDLDGFSAQLARPLNLAFNQPDSGHGKSPFAIDELRIWDSDAAMFRGFPSLGDVSYVYDGQPHSLQLPSEGVDGESLRFSLSKDGPFVDEMPALTNAGTMCVWYVVSVDDLTTVASATVTVTKRPIAFASASAEKPYDGTPLTNGTVAVTGDVPDGEGFTFSVSGAQTAIGECTNAFTWTANDGTNPDNYEVSVTYGRLKVTVASEYAGAGYEILHGPSGDVVRITHLDCASGGDVTLPSSFGGLPVVDIAAGALSGTGVTGVHVPSGVRVEGALFNGLQSISNVSFAAGSSVTGTLSFCGCASLHEVVMPAQELLAPHAFLGCWNLERVVFPGEPPFGKEAPAGSDEMALLVASVRPATLLQMADMICYPEAYATRWEKSLRNFGYGGRYGAYAGEWTGEDSLVAGSGNLDAGSPGADPSGEPAAQYAAQTGRESGTVLAGAVGWDALGVPDGMTWDRTTGTLGGTPKRSGTYDVILVSGSGASTKMMRTTLEVAGYAVTTGYVGTAFKVSGAPWNALASYKTVPAGLAWKSKALSGVPTKTGTWTYKTKDGEPVKVAILALPAGAKGTFNGVVADAAGKRYPLKVSATAAGKLSATVVKGTKSYSLSAAKWSKVTVEDVEGAPHRMFAATLTAKGQSLSVKVDADAVWNADALTAAGTLGAVKGLAGTVQRNAFASDDAAKSVAAARAGTYSLSALSDDSGGWILALPEDGVKGTCTVTLRGAGTATLSGTLPNKAKVDASSTLHVSADGTASLRFYVKGAWIVYTW